MELILRPQKAHGIKIKTTESSWNHRKLMELILRPKKAHGTNIKTTESSWN